MAYTDGLADNSLGGDRVSRWTSKNIIKTLLDFICLMFGYGNWRACIDGLDRWPG